MTSHYNRYKFIIPWWIPGCHAAPAPSSPGSAGCASAVDERREDELLCAVAAWWRFWLGRTHEVWVQWMRTYWILMGYSWDMGGYGILRSWYRWLGCLVYGDEVTVVRWACELTYITGGHRVADGGKSHHTVWQWFSACVGTCRIQKGWAST